MTRFVLTRTGVRQRQRLVHLVPLEPATAWPLPALSSAVPLHPSPSLSAQALLVLLLLRFFFFFFFFFFCDASSEEWQCFPTNFEMYFPFWAKADSGAENEGERGRRTSMRATWHTLRSTQQPSCCTVYGLCHRVLRHQA